MRRKVVLLAFWAVLAFVALGRFAVSAPHPLRIPLGHEPGWRLSSTEGYEVHVPLRWHTVPGAPVEQVLRTSGAQMNLWLQDLRATRTDAWTYVAYSNRSVLQGWAGIRVHENDKVHRHGHLLHVLAWSRPPLRHMAEDFTEYREVNVIRDDQHVLTVQLKATPLALAQATRDQDDLVASLEFKVPALANTAAPWESWPPFPTGGRDWRPWQRRTSLRWQVPEQGVVWGLYDWNIHPSGIKWPQVEKLEAAARQHFDLLMTYTTLGKPFPTAMLEDAAAHGRLTMLTLQSWVPTEQQRVFGSDLTLTPSILSGRYDTYFRTFAHQAKAWGKPFFFRLDNEMNADWCPWGAFHNGKDADLYVAAWRHIWGIFQAEGAENALWVWNPNDTSYPNYRWNHASRYWPGAQYVDWVGLTGYNVGSAYPDSRWRSFREAYASTYAEYRQLYPDKPLLITEFASHDGGGDKAAWMRQMFAALPDFPAIKFAVWWNGTDGARRYRFDSTPAALQAFQAGLAQPYARHFVRD